MRKFPIILGLATGMLSSIPAHADGNNGVSVTSSVSVTIVSSFADCSVNGCFSGNDNSTEGTTLVQTVVNPDGSIEYIY